MDNARKELVVKVVNPTPNSVNATVTVNGIPSLAKTGKVISLGHASNAAENTLDNKTVVMPVEKSLTIAGPEFKYDFTPNSLTIFRIPAQ